MNFNSKVIKYANFSILEISNSDHPECAVIFLHGLGASGKDFENLPKQLSISKKFPIKYIFPSASEKPVTLNQGYRMPAWYDIFSLEFGSREDEEGLLTSSNFIQELISHYIDSGIPAEKLFCGGFSQGGALALYSALRYQRSLGGILGLSTYLPVASILIKEATDFGKNTPIFLAHGTQDEVLPYVFAEHSLEKLKKIHKKICFYSYPIGHTFCLQEFLDINLWIESQLSLTKDH